MHFNRRYQRPRRWCAKTAKELPDIKALVGNYSDEAARRILDQTIFWIDESWRVFAILAFLAVKYSGSSLPTRHTRREPARYHFSATAFSPGLYAEGCNC